MSQQAKQGGPPSSKLLTLDNLKNLEKLVGGLLLVAETRKFDFEDDPQELHNFILEQLIQVFNSIKRNVGENIYNILQKQGSEKSYDKNFDITKQIDNLGSVVSQLKNQFLGDPSKGGKNIYSELSSMKNQFTEQNKALNAQLSALPELKQQLASLDNLVNQSFQMFDDMMMKQEEQNKEIMNKLDQFDERFFSKFQDFTDQFAANQQQSIQVQQVQAHPIVQHQPKVKFNDIVSLQFQQEEEQKSNNSDQSQIIASLQQYVDASYKHALNPDDVPLQQVTSLKLIADQQLEKLQYIQDQKFQAISFKINSVLGNMHSNIPYEDEPTKQQVRIFLNNQFSLLNPSNQESIIKAVINQLFSHDVSIVKRGAQNVQNLPLQVQVQPQLLQQNQNLLPGLDDFSIKEFEITPEHQGLLKQWLGKDSISLKLIYRGSKDGFEAAQYHSKVDGIPHTFSFMKSAQKKSFGAYVSLPEASVSNSWYKDPDAFIFSLTHKTHHPQFKNQEYAVFHDRNTLLKLGSGSDMYIGSKCNLKNDSKSCLGGTYKAPDNGDVYTYLSGGDAWFTVIEFDVYQVIQ